MVGLVDDLLKGIDDQTDISEEVDELEAVANLLKSYQDYRKKYDASLPVMDTTKTGREFKDAIMLLPVQIKLDLLNKFNEDLAGDKIKKDLNKIDPIAKRHKDNLITLIVIGFFVLAFITIGTIGYLSFYEKEIPSSDFFSTIFNTLVEIIKVITGN